jgi:hypothetical protein
MNTLLGTCLFAIQSGEHVSKLRNDITSPGGTTASAIYNLERGSFRTTVSDAVWAAYRCPPLHTYMPLILPLRDLPTGLRHNTEILDS